MKFFHIQKNSLASKRGFTLVEALVGISILSLSILATFTAVQSSLQSSVYAKDQIVAFYLTQEVMEYVKNIRDGNALASAKAVTSGQPAVNWLTYLTKNTDGTSGPCDFGKTCTIDSVKDVATSCTGGWGTCPNLGQDPTTMLYGYGMSYTDTGIKREIQIEQISTTEVIVRVHISWTSSGISRSFTVGQLLFDR